MKTALLFLFAGFALAQTQAPFSNHALKVERYSQEANEAIVKRFQGLRLTDVADALDFVGLQDITMMDTAIKPLWKDEAHFKHRIYGTAVTLRLVPAQERAPIFDTREAYYKWKGDWARRLSRGGHPQFLTRDTVLVIDASDTRDFGICGSNNMLNWSLQGMRGVVTDAGCRDSDEVVLQRIPVYMRGPARGINEGRMVVESWNAPVNVGGVLVMPGDVIVADGDGVVVVPRAKAEAVAAEAHKIQDDDKVTRRRLYEKGGRASDFTMK